MSNVKLKAPLGATSITIADQTFDVDAQGAIEAPDHLVDDLLPHGYVVWSEPEAPKPVEDMSRDELEAAFIASQRAALAVVSDDDIRNALRQGQPKAPEVAGDADPLSLSYNEQKKWLKARGAEVPQPITGEALAELVAAEVAKMKG